MLKLNSAEPNKFSMTGIFLSMKLFNILFLAIKPDESDFLAYRHSIDSQLFCTMHGAFDMRHLKLHTPGYTPAQAHDEVFFEGRNGFFHIPFSMLRYISQEQPDIVMVHGFLFPLQVLALKRYMPAGARLIVQHHAEQPFKNPVKRWLQRKAYAGAHAYLFSSKALAKPFISQRIINDPQKINELPESSTLLKAGDREAARLALNLPAEGLLFLWVGRLDRNKDPFTVLKAFAAYQEQQPAARLYMFYHEAEMLEPVKALIRELKLERAVTLMGYISNKQLEAWYNACDVFISGSHYESTGYALCEAMACGCIPLVTDIPAFRQITASGKAGILYKAGDANDLLNKLQELELLDREQLLEQVIAHFKETLSFEALSDRLKAICDRLLTD